MGRGEPPYRKLTLAEAFERLRLARSKTPKAAPCKREQRGGFMGSRRCRRPIAGLCDWGAGELLGGVVPYWMSLSSYEATMSLSEQVL